MTFIKQGKPRATFEDFLRALGYATIMVWALLFMLYPPTAFINALDFITRAFWMGFTFTGALAACLGAALRIDLKLELPGLSFALIGPFLYFASQLYYVLHPLPGETFNARGALVIYAILPGILLLPRTYALYSESRRLKKIVKDTSRMKEELKRSGEYLLPDKGIRISPRNSDGGGA